MIRKILAMQKAFETVKKRQRENAHKIPDLEERLKRLKVVREQSVGNKELIKTAVENLVQNGFDVRFAKTARDAIDIVIDEVGDCRLIVKSKSNVSREIKLVEELEKKGIEVIETDIGDRVIQILCEEPSHPTGPASHLPVDLILDEFNERYGLKLRNAEELIGFLLKDIKDKICKAEVGITGVNSISSEGSLLILHNEGNVFEVITRPKKWIILATIDKFYPSIDDAVNAAKVQTFFATGLVMPSFIEIISGVSKTADIEKRIYRGIYNPKEAILIVLDNNRSYLIENGFKELFYCIGCGNCVLNCPAHRVFGEKFKGGRFALFSAISGETDLSLCLTCGRCKKNCPLNIDIPSMIKRVRRGSELYNLLVSHIKWLLQSAYINIFRFIYYLNNKI